MRLPATFGTLLSTLAFGVSAATLLATARPAHAGDAPASCSSAEQSCLVVNLKGGGCNDEICCTTVCSIEPACCSTAWDELCVALAVKFCSSCGISENSCFARNITEGCNESNCCNYVCSLPGFEDCCTVQWDADCVKKATQVCVGCGQPGAGDCNRVHEGAGCNNAECCDQVCTVDATCCQTSWDDLCVQWAAFFCPGCGDPAAGNCCVAHTTPFCDDVDCCEAVCEIDDFCCTVRWDVNCVELASTVCSLPNCLCGDPNAGSCKSVHPTPGCNDLDCCTQVCLFDDFCCIVAWDQACKNAAEALCTTNPSCGDVGKGSCFVRHDTPGCDDAGCCEAVCAVDPNCCAFKWDQQCADLAPIICTDCGDIDAGSCFEPHGSAACADEDCCEAVCAIDPFCCSDLWDSVCVSLAVAGCDDPIGNCGANLARSCFVPSAYLPGCEDAGCCVDVCTTVDPYCCEVRWDAACVEHAFSICDTAVGCPKRGSCLIPHVNPGCNDPICCTAVCQIDPICCLNTWDEQCALYAYGVCFGQSACPGVDTCWDSHGTPGCEDPACCNVVCAIDPVCCIEAWDQNCVAVAQARCVPDSNWNCPCLGSCFEQHGNPGCDDAACCSGVCSIDPLCCTVAWDDECALLARVVCCGDIGCGNYCAGTCFDSHDQPFCNDAACCDAVCMIDPFCCSNRWDGVCAEFAFERCSSLCGLPDGGSCFVPKITPACSDRDCCDAVCAADPICCTTTWDEACVDLAQGKRGRRGLCEPPECGSFAAGDCCDAKDIPACNDEQCCEAVCRQDPFCCDSQWDATCAGLARENSACGCVSECGDICAGSCCVAKETPLCDDEACCEAVCALDPFCCELNGGAWDAVCASLAASTDACGDVCPQPECGDLTAGDCCTPHAGPACNDLSCCESVCAIDSFCCESQWDIACAILAGEECPECQSKLFCGSATAGDCFTTHPTPYCDNFGCCSFVCTIDPSCCSVDWDTTCVDLASAFCGG